MMRSFAVSRLAAPGISALAPAPEPVAGGIDPFIAAPDTLGVSSPCEVPAIPVEPDGDPSVTPGTDRTHAALRRWIHSVTSIASYFRTTNLPCDIPSAASMR